MSIQKGMVLTGARARLMLNGVKVMYCQGVNYSEEIEYQPVEPLDQYEVAEHVPVAYRVTFSAEMTRVVNNPIKQRDGVSVMPRLEDITNAPALTGTIEDRLTGAVLANIEQVKLQRYTSNIGRAIVLTSCEFVAIRVRDESELK